MRFIIGILALFFLACPSTAHPNYPGLERVERAHSVKRHKVVKVKKVRKAALSTHRVKHKRKAVAAARPHKVKVIQADRRGRDGVERITPKVSVGTSNVVRMASRYIGTNPTKMRRLWCANFVGMIEKKAGRRGTGSNLALSYARYGKAVPLRHAQPGDIVVLKRRGGGHVGYYAGPGSRPGTVKLISGNTGGKRGKRIVSAGNYSTKRIVAVRRVS